MTSKLGHWERSARHRAEPPSLIRSTLEFASQVMSLWKPRGSALCKKPATSEVHAEETIAEILQKLEGEHLVFHDVTSGYGSIDHVIFSQEKGIFLLESKAHSGRVSVVDCQLRVNGKPPEKDFVAQTLRNTYWLIEEIRNVTGAEARVTPLLVFINASVDMGRPVKGIPMTDRQTLLATIQREGEPMPESLWKAREKIGALLTAPRVAPAS